MNYAEIDYGYSYARMWTRCTGSEVLARFCELAARCENPPFVTDSPYVTVFQPDAPLPPPLEGKRVSDVLVADYAAPELNAWDYSGRAVRPSDSRAPSFQAGTDVERPGVADLDNGHSARIPPIIVNETA